MAEEIQETQEDQIEILDEESAFDEATGGEAEKEVETPAEDAEKSIEPDTDREDKEAQEVDEESKEQEPGAPKTAKEIADERASKLLERDAPGKKAEEEAPPSKQHQYVEEPPPPKVQDKQTKPSRMTKEQIADFLGNITDDDLPDGEIIVGDQSVDLKAYKENFPEEYAVMQIMAGAIAQKMVQKGGYVDAQQVQQMQQQYQGEFNNLWFWQQVGMEHPDALKTARSQGFTDWLGKQSRGIQLLADSPNPDDGIALIGLYKEEQAKANVAKHDAKARGEKKKKDDLHKGTLRAGMKSDKNNAEIDSEDEQSGFNLFFQKKQNQSY